MDYLIFIVLHEVFFKCLTHRDIGHLPFQMPGMGRPPSYEMRSWPLKPGVVDCLTVTSSSSLCTRLLCNVTLLFPPFRSVTFFLCTLNLGWSCNLTNRVCQKWHHVNSRGQELRGLQFLPLHPWNATLRPPLKTLILIGDGKPFGELRPSRWQPEPSIRHVSEVTLDLPAPLIFQLMQPPEWTQAKPAQELFQSTKFCSSHLLCSKE